MTIHDVEENKIVEVKEDIKKTKKKKDTSSGPSINELLDGDTFIE